jgi:hypothetical protein
VRAILAATVILIACAALTARAQAPSPTSIDMDRPGGGYASVPAQSPPSCAALCAQDPICMAWSVRAESCELKAVIPQPVSSPGAVSGLSSRAPEFSRRIAALDAPDLETPTLTAPALAVAATSDLAAPARDLAFAELAASTAPDEAAAPADELLGGRLAESDLGIRRRLRP